MAALASGDARRFLRLIIRRRGQRAGPHIDKRRSDRSLTLYLLIGGVRQNVRAKRGNKLNTHTNATSVKCKNTRAKSETWNWTWTQNRKWLSLWNITCSLLIGWSTCRFKVTAIYSIYRERAAWAVLSCSDFMFHTPDLALVFLHIY